MPGLKLNHVSKRGHSHRDSLLKWWITYFGLLSSHQKQTILTRILGVIVCSQYKLDCIMKRPSTVARYARLDMHLIAETYMYERYFI